LAEVDDGAEQHHEREDEEKLHDEQDRPHLLQNGHAQRDMP
jgi:hypothetical protein